MAATLTSDMPELRKRDDPAGAASATDNRSGKTAFVPFSAMRRRRLFAGRCRLELRRAKIATHRGGVKYGLKPARNVMSLK